VALANRIGIVGGFMRITVLVEDATGSPALGNEHGLSLYIETQSKKILFDMGASGLFIENAEKLGLRIRDIDLAVISHGHYDHGGGLNAFLKENEKAPVYIHSKAFEGHYSAEDGKIIDVGIDKAQTDPGRMIPTGDFLQIDDDLLLFTKVTGNEFCPSCNSSLLAGHPEELIPDSFEHEQNLVITENGKTVLITGCAHRGIVNILKSCKNLMQKTPDYVIGGFHLSVDGKAEDPSVLREIGGVLKNISATYYTGHCTGTDAYLQLKAVMGDRIRYLSPGFVINI